MMLRTRRISDVGAAIVATIELEKSPFFVAIFHRRPLLAAACRGTSGGLEAVEVARGRHLGAEDAPGGRRGVLDAKHNVPDPEEYLSCVAPHFVSSSLPLLDARAGEGGEMVLDGLAAGF